MYRYLILIYALIISLNAFSKEPEPLKPIDKPDSKDSRNQRATNFDTTSLEKTIREVARETSNKPDNNSNENLKISRKVEEYTGEVTRYTLWIAIVGLVQMFLFAIQLAMMRSTVRDTKIAAVAAKDSISISREAYIASERPWISVEAKVSSSLFRKHEGIEFGIDFTVKNHGVSPAINVHIIYELVTLKIEQNQFSKVREKINQMGTIPDVGKNRGTEVYPGEEKIIPWISTLTNKEIAEGATEYTQKNSLIPSFYAIGTVFYESVFDKRIWQTGFNYYVFSTCDPKFPNGSDFPVFVESFPMYCVLLQRTSHNKGDIN